MIDRINAVCIPIIVLECLLILAISSQGFTKLSYLQLFFSLPLYKTMFMLRFLIKQLTLMNKLQHFVYLDEPSIK